VGGGGGGGFLESLFISESDTMICTNKLLENNFLKSP